jgi:formylglycine-generating enzyme required for sulfatase activity
MKMQARRGGLWLFRNAQRGARLAYRSLEQSNSTNECTGFRVACLPPEAKPVLLALRGGSYAKFGYPLCRSTCRVVSRPDFTDDGIGFRVICLPPS